MTAPCGVPCFVSDHWPSSDTPALSHFWIRRSILRSALKMPKACWRSPGSRPCCFLCVHGLYRLRRTGRPLALTQLPYCLPPTRQGVGILIPRFYEAQSPGPPMPRSTLRHTPRGVSRKTRGQDGFAISFPAGTCTPTTWRFIPAHGGYRIYGRN
jgi:hypothetical protein